MTSESARTPQDALVYLLQLSDELNRYLQRGEFNRTATPDQRELIKGLRAVVQGISISFGRSIGINVSHASPGEALPMTQLYPQFTHPEELGAVEFTLDELQGGIEYPE